MSIETVFMRRREMMLRLPDEMLKAMQVRPQEIRVKPERKPWRWPAWAKAKPAGTRPRMA
jgi:hypothetical protein